MTERVGFSLGRIATIAGNTFVESLRQKVYNILLIFALVVIASASFFSQFTFSEQLKFVKDFCLGAISIFGTLIAIVGTAQLLPAELENRTIYTILAKPVRRFEFLLGKYLGSLSLIFLSLVVMSVMLGAALLFKEHRLVAEARQADLSAEEKANTIQRIHREARDGDLVKAVSLTLMKLSLLAAITLMFSTVSTSMVFNVVAGFMAFFAGSLRATAVEMWGSNRLFAWLATVIPDLSAFNVADDIILGNAIPWAHVGSVAVYGLVYTAVVILVSYLVFADREI